MSQNDSSWPNEGDDTPSGGGGGTPSSGGGGTPSSGGVGTPPSSGGGGTPPSGGGGTPPPSGGGGTPPPSGGGAGTPPPTPPGGGMGGGPSGGSGGPLGQGGGFSVGDAFNYGWQKFQANVGSIVLGSLIYIGAALVLFILWFFIAGAIAGIGGDSNAGAIAFLMSMAVFGLAYFALQFVIQAGITRGGLAITYGRPLELQTFLSTDGLPQILLGSLILGLTAAVGTFLCLIPGLIVIFFTQFFPHFVLDKQMSAVEAMRASAQFVNRNLATMVALFIASTIALMIGYLLCFIGILAAFPVVVIAQTYAYRVLQGESVAA